jgi:phosphinothricin acetyltransferase
LHEFSENDYHFAVDFHGMMFMNLVIRNAREDDLPAINAIYNHFVAISTCTYQMESNSEEERRAWYHDHTETEVAREKFPIIVVESVDTSSSTVPRPSSGEIVGWGSLSPFHRREGYRYTVENSVYVHPSYHRRGIGRAILAELIHRADAAGHRTIVAVISADQEASIHLHAAMGFVETGRLRNVGNKFQRWLDVAYMQRDCINWRRDN